MDIELTSARDDETFTWRAAGARQPRGSVATALLPAACKVGDVLRAEVEVEIDGITVVSVLPPKEKPVESGRIEYIGPPRPEPGVTTVLASRSDRRGGPSERGRENKGRRRDAEREGARRERDGSHRDEGRRRTAPASAGRSDARRPEGAEAGRPRSEGQSPEVQGTRERSERGARRPAAGRPAGRGQTTPRRGPVRFEPGTAHRDELFESLTPEQRPIAERLAVGGLPAVRKALSEEQERARAEGRPVISGEQIVALAEQLLPDVKSAVWLDRAEAAVGRVDEITLRDLRATVVGASARDEAGRELEHQLREALERRVNKLRQDWEQHLTQAIDDGRVLQALRLSAKPPEPTARFPGALGPRLAELAGQAMTEETAPERWLSLLEAAAESPVRRQVKPVGIPKDTTGEVERQARRTAGRIPSLARLLGMPIPPPPQPVAGERHAPARPPRRRGPKPAGRDGASRQGTTPKSGETSVPEAVVPAEPAEPLSPSDPAEPVVPVDVPEPLLPAEPPEPLLPADVPEPVVPLEPEEPVVPVEPLEPPPPPPPPTPPLAETDESTSASLSADSEDAVAEKEVG